MKFSLLIFLATSASLFDAQSMDEAGPELDLEYYSNLAINETELNEDAGDHTLDANLFEGDIAGFPTSWNETSDDELQNRNAVTSRKWPGGIIPYTYYKGYSEKEKAVIAKAIVRLQETTCLIMKPRTTEVHYISIRPIGGCWTSIGYYMGRHTVSLDRGCFYVGTALHEFMHAAGFYHEQSRTDRDEYVQVKWENIFYRMKHNFEKYTDPEVDDLNAPYDTCSIMHYPSNAFSKNGNPTIVKIKPGNCELGQKHDFSDWDIRKLNTLYECSEYLTVDCFDKGRYHCGILAKRNYCSDDSKYVGFMKKNCCATCRLAKGCHDYRAHCYYWQQNGYCSGKYKEFMAYNCKKSCKIC